MKLVFYFLLGILISLLSVPAFAINGYPDTAPDACSLALDTPYHYWPSGSADPISLVKGTSGVSENGSLDTTWKPQGYIVRGGCGTGDYYANTQQSYANKNPGGCASGSVPNSQGACVAPSICDTSPGVVVSSGMYDLGTSQTANPPRITCDGTCELSYTGSGVVARALVGGVYHYYSDGSYTRTTSKCSGASTALTGGTLPAPTCNSTTQDSGTVNGVFVCLDKSKTTTTTVETTTSTSGDVKTDVTTATTTNADGTQTTYTKTTTTNTTTGATATTTTQIKTDPDQGFCTANPTAPGCQKISDECLKNPGLLSCQQMGDVPTGDTVPRSSIPVTFSPVAIASNATCPAPLTVTLSGFTIPIDFDPICSYASQLRPVILAVSYLSAILIVFGVGRSPT